MSGYHRGPRKSSHAAVWVCTLTAAVLVAALGLLLATR